MSSQYGEFRPTIAAEIDPAVWAPHGAIINWRRHDVIWLKPTAVGIPQAHRPKTNVMRA